MTYLELLQMIKNETQPEEVTYRGDTYIWNDGDRSYHCGHKWLVEEMGEVMTDHEFCELDIIDKPKEKEETIPIEWLLKYREKVGNGYINWAVSEDYIYMAIEEWRKENEKH